MRNFFRTWVDLIIFFPVSLALAIGSYWFVPFILKLFEVREQDMAYTGTAWIYQIFQVWFMFFGGVVLTFITYKGCYSLIHKYHESQEYDIDFNGQTKPFKITVSLLIPTVFFLGYCILCSAAFK